MTDDRIRKILEASLPGHKPVPAEYLLVARLGMLIAQRDAEKYSTQLADFGAKDLASAVAACSTRLKKQATDHGRLQLRYEDRS